ncbi:hypothetical protein [Moorena sp. SIO4G3]|uniref:hypothetical protein n=1 Tax=Moorena sp. SIO4G3 TaxID=2607821 RepID=UPI0025FC5923|nr:hypothetical protein [Moorena sp. SIO4G3]
MIAILNQFRECLFPAPYFLLPTPYSLLPIPYSLLPLLNLESSTCPKQLIINLGNLDVSRP